MAEYLIQDTTLAAIGDAIRAKGESSDPIPVSEIAARIAAIETGVTVQRASGAFSTSSSGAATVNCGFQPDAVLFSISGFPEFYAVFESDGVKALTTSNPSATTYFLLVFSIERTSTGFKVSGTKRIDLELSESNYSGTFNYTAVKYT